ncbi:hypothetical protein [Myroides profundi]|uniref:Uncharacterized protein n=1 Tax=Myroides profundi TaxID=480520 RepID=A0AAJ5BE52_MYRPR|nr:hypothetical protein [Myroides profundi]AJH14523.1 hypothetical protein MPR_1341 [Myroides profundi]SEQ93878.1 hypothetical protein SAMN04488089_107167 [Myroides profundi]
MDTKKLREFIDFTSKLMQKEENSWMFSELLYSLKKDGYLIKGADDAMLLDIYEYCLEENLRKQAEGFYSDFKTSHIKEELILDFIAMERARRNNDFYSFAVATYQQFENIINTLFKDEIEPTWERDSLKVIEGMGIKYDPKKNQEYLIYTPISSEFITQKQMVLRAKKELEIKWYPNQKFNIVMYRFMFNETVGKYKLFNHFNQLLTLFGEVYLCRNQVHRGSVNKSKYKENTINKINSNQSQYYFKFYYLLEQFVSGITKE